MNEHRGSWTSEYIEQYIVNQILNKSSKDSIDKDEDLYCKLIELFIENNDTE